MRLSSLPATPARAHAVALAAAFVAGFAVPHARADTALTYVALTEPCRLLDTRSAQGGPGPLTAANGNYTFGTSDADIEAPTQNGNVAGCALPAGILAVSMSLNQLNTTAAGNLRLWSTDAGSSGPGAGTTVFNPSISPPHAGQVLYSAGFATVPVGASDGRFYLSVANGQLDLTANVVGYWLPAGWQINLQSLALAGPNSFAYGTNALASGTGSAAAGEDSVALGHQNGTGGQYAVAIGDYSQAPGDFSQALGSAATASGGASTAIGNGVTASAFDSLVFGNNSAASGQQSFAIGNSSNATSQQAIALGNSNTASGVYSFAIGNSAMASASGAMAFGNGVTASGLNTLALGSDATSTDKNNVAHTHGFVFGDGSTQTLATMDNQFVARAKNGFVLYTSAFAAGTAQSTGAYLNAGSGSWGALSDRNAKDAVQPIDGRDVLDRVVAMPLATWHYKAQDPKFRHMGPMAQDFYAAFGLGETELGIDTIDADGVALAAIQGLNAKLESERRAHDDALAERDRRIADLEARMAALTSAMNEARDRASP